MVKVHGNYCGPNWTAGQNKPASMIDDLPYVAPIDRLDAGCLVHDRECKNGCTAKADRKLRNVALSVAATNPRLRPIALFVALGMEGAARTRRK